MSLAFPVAPYYTPKFVKLPTSQQTNEHLQDRNYHKKPHQVNLHSCWSHFQTWQPQFPRAHKMSSQLERTQKNQNPKLENMKVSKLYRGQFRWVTYEWSLTIPKYINKREKTEKMSVTSHPWKQKARGIVKK